MRRSVMVKRSFKTSKFQKHTMISSIFARSVRRSGNRAFLSTWSHNGMDDETFTFMRDVLAAPSPVGLEAR